MKYLSYLNPFAWNRKMLIASLIAFGLIWFGFIDVYSISTRIKLSSEIIEMHEEIESLQAKADRLEVELESFKKNPDLLEKIARETYFMRKPGEKVYRILEK
jgi:cell division protein FtsB